MVMMVSPAATFPTKNKSIRLARQSRQRPDDRDGVLIHAVRIRRWEDTH